MFITLLQSTVGVIYGDFVCILTESHRQLETRFWVKYFPTTVESEKKRYPDIPTIIDSAKNAGLERHKIVVTDKETEFTIAVDFVNLVENKGYSMFRLIEDSDYEAGLAALKKDYENQTVLYSNHGETLMWLRKGAQNG